MEEDLKRLEELGSYQMNPDFLEQSTQIRKKIFKKIKPKMLNGISLNGGMLSELIKIYVEVVNSGGVPNIDYAWNNLQKHESNKAFTG